MIKVDLKGTIKEYEAGTTVAEIAKSISEGLARNACAALVDGELTDLRAPVSKDCVLEILTFDQDGGKWAYRHTASHILAQAVKRLYPGVKLAIGPAIDEGFYYDFDCEKPFTPEDVEKIEAEMQAIIKENITLERFVLPRDEAIKYAESLGEPYKAELISELPEGEEISFYRQGDFTDLCAGPHMPSTKSIKAVKITSIAGAYWRGSEKNKMLTRLYGTAFTKQSDMDEYLKKLEEVKKRDHRKLGKELKLFALMDEGQGFPFFLPNGMIVKNELVNYWREVHRKAGYSEISTPIMLTRDLWLRSGHWDHYRENIYTSEIDEQDYCLKPMNCPGGMLVYKQGMYSYRDLPLRMAELGIVHRHEKSGTLHGMMRVRCFTQDDAHLFMMKEQIKDEVIGVVKLIDEVYSIFGLKYRLELSTKPENSMGSEEDWEEATNALRGALEALGKDFQVNEGDGAFYGPKIDFHLEDALGRTWQCGTVQLDFQMPEKFELEYTGADGAKHRPVMIHRVAYGAIERFIAILIEHYAGQFPVWLAPVQAKVLPISNRFDDYAMQISKELEENGIRTECDLRAEKIGYKIREARNERVPYIVVVGEKEQENGNISLRSRKGDEGVMELCGLIARVKKEIATRENNENVVVE